MDFNKISRLTIKIKKDSEKHFKIFFQETHAVVFRVCIKMGLNQEDAEDIVQDTFVQFWKQRDSIDENNGVIGLLKLIAKRLVIKKINKKELLISNDFEVLHKVSDDTNHNRVVNSNLIKENIERLPLAQKEIITLFYLEGLTTIEIANYLKISTRTVENNLYRAKKRFKQILETQNLNTNSFYDFFNE